MLALRRVPTISQYLSRVSVYSLRWKSKRSDKDSQDFNAELLSFERKSSGQARSTLKIPSEQKSRSTRNYFTIFFDI